MVNAEGEYASIIVRVDIYVQSHELDDSLPVRMCGVGHVACAISNDWFTRNRIYVGLMVLPGVTRWPIERLQKVILGVVCIQIRVLTLDHICSCFSH